MLEVFDAMKTMFDRVPGDLGVMISLLIEDVLAYRWHKERQRLARN